MKEYKNSKGERIEEYSFEDWKKGINPYGKDKSSYSPVLVSETGEKYWQVRPYEELEKIRAEQRRLYFESVEGYFSMYCNQFTELYETTGNKERLLKTEIEKFEYIFFPDKRVNSPLPVGLNMTDFEGYDLFYQQEYILQKIDFSTIEFKESYFNGRQRIYASAKYLHWLKEKLPVQLKTDTESPIQKENNFPIPPKKTFPEYLIHNDREKLAELIKNEFAKEKGKGIRLMLLALEKSDPQLIATNNREMKSIIESLRLFFETNIGTYQSINDFKFEENTHSLDLQGFKIRINHILTNMNK